MGKTHYRLNDLLNCSSGPIFFQQQQSFSMTLELISARTEHIATRNDIPRIDLKLYKFI